MRQFTMACAVCGRALLAWPAVRRVATQVVRKLELKLGSAAARRAGGCHIRRRGQNGAHVRCRLACLLAGKILEVGSRDLVHLEGKGIGGELVERGGQLIDRVVGPGQRAVAAAIGGRDLEIGVDLFGGLDIGDHGAAVVQLHAACVGIDDVGRIDQIAMVAAPANRPR